MTGPDVALFESATSASIPGRLVLLLSIPLPSRAEAASLSVEPQASVLRSGNAPHQLPWSEVTIRNEAQDSVTVTVGFNKHEIEVVPEKVGAIVGGGEVTIKTRLTGRTARTAPLGSLLVIGGKELIRIPISIDPPTVKSWQLTTYFGWPIGHDRRGTKLPGWGVGARCEPGTAILSSGSRTATVRWDCANGAVRLHPHVASWFYGAKYTGKLMIGPGVEPIDITVRNTWAVWIVVVFLVVALAIGYKAARFLGSGRALMKIQNRIFTALGGVSTAATSYLTKFEGLAPRPCAASYDVAQLTVDEGLRLNDLFVDLAEKYPFAFEKADGYKGFKVELEILEAFVADWPSAGRSLAQLAGLVEKTEWRR